MLWGLVGASAAIGVEVLYVRTTVQWVYLLPLIVPLQLLVSRSIYEIVKGDSILAVSVFFSFGTATLRALATLGVGQPVTRGGWIAYGFIILALLVKLTERWFTCFSR